MNPLEDPRVRVFWDQQTQVLVAECFPCGKVLRRSPNHDAVEESVAFHLAGHDFADEQTVALRAEVAELTEQLAKTKGREPLSDAQEPRVVRSMGFGVGFIERDSEGAVRLVVIEPAPDESGFGRWSVVLDPKQLERLREAAWWVAW